MDRLQHIVIDLTVWGFINLWWVERWFIYGIEESPGLPESDSVAADLLLFPHSCSQPSLHLSSQQCNLQPQGCKAQLQSGWKLAVCLTHRKNPKLHVKTQQQPAYIHMQKVLCPQGFCTIRYKITIPWTVVIVGVQENIPWCCMSSLSSGWRSLAAAAELQSSQFCHHSPHWKLAGFKTLFFLFST